MSNICSSCGHIGGFEYPDIQLLIKSDKLEKSKNKETRSLTNYPALMCQKCGRPIILLDIATAAVIVQKSKKTIYNWVKQVRVKFLVLPDERVLIFYNSLFLPPSTNGSSEPR
jgi:hypothetical protein